MIHAVPLFALLTLIALFGLPDPAFGDGNESVTPAQLEQLKRNIAKLDRWLSKANSEKSGLVKQLQQQEKDIAYIGHRLRQLKSKNQQIQARIEELGKAEHAQSRQLKAQQQTLIAQLRTMHRQGNQPALKLLLDSNDPRDATRYLHYFSYLSQDQESRLAEYQAAVAQLKQTRQNALKQQQALQENRQQLTEQLSSIKEKRKKRSSILAKLDKKLKSETQRLDKLKADHTRLEQLLREVEQAIADIPLPKDAGPFAALKKKLPWPTEGKVIERFGKRVAQGKLRSNGIRIATGNQQDVKAVHYGRIVFSDWLRGFGLLIIVDHGAGYMSLYGNNESLAKETGDWVRAGEIIAYSGDSGGKKQSGLYFEIRKQGKPQNPAAWLKPGGNRS